MFQHFRQQMPALMGAALLTLVVDGLILIYRLMGLSRPTAVYAGLLTFVLFGSVVARHVFKPHPLNDSGENKYV